MTQARAFLQDIIANQDDDAPRLVYADWLEDHGEPERAEFIRLQCALARMGEEDAGRPALARRELALWADHGERWLGELPSWVTRRQDCKFRRGFPVHIVCTGRQLLDRGASLWRAAPIESIRLRDAGELAAELAALPHLAHLRELDLSIAWMSAREAATLVRSPYLTGLKSLNLRGGASASLGLARALTSTHLARLRRLDLYGHDNGFGAAGARILASASALGALEVLNLGFCRVGPEGAVALVSSPHLGALRNLDLDACDVGDRGAARLADCPGLARLTVLHLPQNNIGNRGAAALAASPHLAGLRVLRLWNNPITEAGALALAASPHLAGLTTLTLSNNYRWKTHDHQLDPRGADALKARFGDRVGFT